MNFLFVLVLVPLFFFLPGYLFSRLLFRNPGAFSAGERVFLPIATSVLVISWLALVSGRTWPVFSVESRRLDRGSMCCGRLFCAQALCRVVIPGFETGLDFSGDVRACDFALCTSRRIYFGQHGRRRLHQHRGKYRAHGFARDPRCRGRTARARPEQDLLLAAHQPLHALYASADAGIFYCGPAARIGSAAIFASLSRMARRVGCAAWRPARIVCHAHHRAPGECCVLFAGETTLWQKCGAAVVFSFGRHRAPVLVCRATPSPKP